VKVDSTGWQAATPGQPKPGKKWATMLGCLIIAFILLAGYDLVTSRGVVNAKPAAATSAAASRTARATGTGRRGTPAKASPSPSPSRRPSPATTPARALMAVSVAAFGPDGTSDGDSPGYASRVLASGDDLGWSSAWYGTAHFGALQAGTGLLVDMGRRVSVSSVRLELGSALGADVEVRLGNTPDMAGLSTAASASDVGGTVRLPLSSPVSARYVLIWFTLLPPDSAGTYQVTVYQVTVDGVA
jgi:hypothetical protein